MTSYEIAVEQAKAMSPYAKVRIADGGTHWEACIPTGVFAPSTLPDAYRGTPAWEKYQKPNGLYPNDLLSWANHNKILDKPLEYIADYYNLSEIEGEEMAVFANQFHKETGVDNLDWSGEITNEQFGQYEDNIQKALTMVDSTNRNNLDEKWKYLV